MNNVPIWGIPRLGWTELTTGSLAEIERALDASVSEGTRDELGFGSIHFAYADRFFPGTSVLQTRLRYLWFVCWSYLELADQAPGQPFRAETLRGIEVRTGRRLMRAITSPSNLNGCGIIGWRRFHAGGSPVVMPSRIYWNALRTWHVLQNLEVVDRPPNQSEVHGLWDQLTSAMKGGDEASVATKDLFQDVPPPPKDWHRANDPLTLDLDKTETDHIRRRWSSLRQLHSGHIGKPLLSLLCERSEYASIKSIWDPKVRELADSTDRPALERARRAASLVCIGRALYAAMIEELKAGDPGGNPSSTQHRTWLEELAQAHAKAACELDVDQLLLDGVRFDKGFRELLIGIQEWAVHRGSYAKLKRPFAQREHALKGERAMLQPSASDRRTRWMLNQPAHPLDYRWPIVSRFLKDLAATA